MNKSTISKVMAELGKRGGVKGGKSTSKAKRRASAENLIKARKNRWKDKPLARTRNRLGLFWRHHACLSTIASRFAPLNHSANTATCYIQRRAMSAAGNDKDVRIRSLRLTRLMTFNVI